MKLAALLLLLQAQAASVPLESYVTDNPVAARDSVNSLLQVAVHEQGRIEEARALAAAIASTWSDDFPARRVSMFESWNADDRRRWARADSLKRAGNDALFTVGVDAAMNNWRRAVELLDAMGDRAGAAAVTGNIGVGFYQDGVLDSATVYLERARVAAMSERDIKTAANSTVLLGNVLMERGDLSRALEAFNSAADDHERIGAYGALAIDHNNMGIIAERVGDPVTARREYETALDWNSRYGPLTRSADYILNIATLDANLARFEEAADGLANAQLIYEREGETWSVALTNSNRASIASRSGDLSMAEELYRSAIEGFSATGDAARELQARIDLASVIAATGRAEEALDVLDGAATHATATGDRRSGARIRLVRGDVLLQFDRLAEARTAYGAALSAFRSAGTGSDVADARQGLAMVDMELGDFAAAASDFQQNAAALAAMGDESGASWNEVLRARALGEMDRYAEALEETTNALSGFDSAREPRGAAYALYVESTLRFERGETAAASELAAAAFSRAADAGMTETWLFEAQLARTLENHQRGSALEHYRDAIRNIERYATGVERHDLRSAFLSDQARVYERFAALQRAEGRPELALATSERLRRRGGVFAPTRGRERDRRDLRTRIADLNGRINRASDAGRRDVGSRDENTAVLQEELNRLQDSYAELYSSEGDRGFDESAIRDAMRGLNAGETVLEYLVADDEMTIFVIEDSTVYAVPVSVGRRDLDGLVRFFRAMLEDHGNDERRLWRAPLERLSELLLRPVEDRLGPGRVLIVPHRELHYLPFEALLTERGRYLIQEHEVAYVPSLASLANQATRTGRPAGVSVLAAAPSPADLPGTLSELSVLDEVFPDATVLRGDGAGEVEVARRIWDASIVHLATRGVLNRRNPLFSYVELAPDRGDGRLEVHEVLDLRLRADLVVLSACQTGLGSGYAADVPAGDDWVGLTGAFLASGASSVIATLWRIDDRSSASLVERFYREVAGGADFVTSLSAAKRAAIENPETSSPFHWASFVLVGSPAGNLERQHDS